MRLFDISHFFTVDILPLPPNILPAPLACVNDDWTAWYDVDSPTGDGDFESLSFIIESYPEMVCDQPTHVEGRVARKGTDARDSGQRISLNPMVGLLCRNEENLERCLDYEVRFCCPRGKIEPIQYTSNQVWKAQFLVVHSMTFFSLLLYRNFTICNFLVQIRLFLPFVIDYCVTICLRRQTISTKQANQYLRLKTNTDRIYFLQGYKIV